MSYLLTADLRAELRAAVDRRVRELVADADGIAGRCRGCQCLYEEQSAGCETCWDRHRRYRVLAEVRAGNLEGRPHGSGLYARGCRCLVCRSADSLRRQRLKARRKA